MILYLIYLLFNILGVLKKYSPYSATFKFCPGIAEATYREYYDVVRFDPKSLRKTESPVFRIDSKLCPMWFVLGKIICTGNLKRVKVCSLPPMQ